MKDAAQDGSGKDLSKERATGEAAQQHLTLSLNSAIGMGVALDPMAVVNKSSNLVLKSDGTKRTNLINGYALVDDDEGEPPAADIAPMLKPMGRGRGSTLPAWMTQSSGPTGIKDENEETKNRTDRIRKTKKERKQHKQDRRRHREELRHDRKHRRRSTDSDEDNRRKKQRHAGIHSDGTQGDAHSGSESEDDLRRRRYEKERTRKRRGLELNKKDSLFKNVDDAKKLIAKLEADEPRPRH
jgi:hypothetical protein